MGNEIAAGVYFYPLRTIQTTGGSVMHAIKGLDHHLPVFGECYFSTAQKNDPKAWKKHTKMICNIFVPKGAVRFVFYDDRPAAPVKAAITEFTLSAKTNYGRLVINPGIWFGFSGIDDEESIILNVADILHDPAESLRLEPGNSQIPYNWKFEDTL